MSMTDAGGMYSPALFSAGFGSMRKDRREFSAELPVKPQEEPTFYAELSTVMLEPVEMGGDDVQPFLPFGSNMDGGAYDRYTSTDHSSAAWERRLRDSQEGRMGASRGVEGPSSAATWETEEEEEDIVNSRAWRRQHEGSDSEEEEERGRGRSANWEVHGSERGRMLH